MVIYSIYFCTYGVSNWNDKHIQIKYIIILSLLG